MSTQRGLYFQLFAFFIVRKELIMQHDSCLNLISKFYKVHMNSYYRTPISSRVTIQKIAKMWEKPCFRIVFDAEYCLTQSSVEFDNIMSSIFVLSRSILDKLFYIQCSIVGNIVTIRWFIRRIQYSEYLFHTL